MSLAVPADPPDSRSGPALKPLPRVIPAPADNPSSRDKVELGRLLFFDPRLSGDNSVSCASCHIPERAWSDGLPAARVGGRTLHRNTQSSLNVALLPKLMWDGRAASLEQQALLPMASPDEMNQDLQQLVTELQTVPGYRQRFRLVSGRGVTSTGIARALAAFQRTLVTKPSRVDRYLAGELEILTDSEKNGLELFRGDAGCIRCHHGPLLTDGKLYRLGVSFRDRGHGAVTGKKEDNYRFRTPPLRNVALTAPYMHDGTLKTLEDVVFFYLRGVPGSSPDGQSLDIQARSDLSFSAASELVDFLKALTGEMPQVDVPTLP